MARSRLGLCSSVMALALLASPGLARADRIVLRGGGQARGKVLPDPARKDRVSILTETGKTPLSLDRSKILEVVPEPGPLDDYLREREKAGTSAEAQYQLGLWCEQHKLADLAEVHYEAALRRDNAFAPAHQKLGHVLYGTRWLTPDEVREAQGLVKYKGKWITPEEKAERDAQAAVTAEQLSWVRRLRQLRQAAAFGAEDRARQAEAQLMEIRDPVAVKPLMQVFGEDADPLRSLLDRVLGLIPGPEAASALVTRILYEPVGDVRRVTFEQVQQRTEPNVVRLLVKALSSSDPAIVNRAAWTLAGLRAVSTVPDLIPALITTQERVVMGGGGGGGAPAGMSFGSVSPMPSRTLSAINSAGASFGVGGGATGSRGPLPRLVTVSYRNVEVRGALARLTGQDFGYDIAAWKDWLRRDFHPEKEKPVRRVPQP